MANILVTPDKLAAEAITYLENELVLAKSVHRDHSKEFVQVGDTIEVDRPVQWVGQENNLDVSSYSEDITMGKVPIKMDRTFTIPFSLTPEQLTLDVRDERMQDWIGSVMIKFKDHVETEIAGLYPYFYHFQGTPGTPPSDYEDVANANALMTEMGVPADGRRAFHSPRTMVKLSKGLTGTYVQGKALQALERNSIGTYGQIEHIESVHMPTHTVGAHAGTPLIDGGTQSVTYEAVKDTYSQTLNTKGWSSSVSGILKKGDVFTIDGVFAVNPISLESTGQLQTFTVLADADSDGAGNAALTISPAIIPATATVASGRAYAVVNSVPADDAAITVISGTAGASYRQSMIFRKPAIAFVSRPLKIASGEGLKTATKTGNYTAISCSTTTDFNDLNRKWRFDILFGRTVLDPRQGMRQTS